MFAVQRVGSHWICWVWFCTRLFMGKSDHRGERGCIRRSRSDLHDFVVYGGSSGELDVRLLRHYVVVQAAVAARRGLFGTHLWGANQFGERERLHSKSRYTNIPLGTKHRSGQKAGFVSRRKAFYQPRKSDAFGGSHSTFGLHLHIPCDTLDNCPGHSGREQGSIVPERACFHRWRSSVGRASDL